MYDLTNFYKSSLKITSVTEIKVHLKNFYCKLQIKALGKFMLIDLKTRITF